MTHVTHQQTFLTTLLDLANGLFVNDQEFNDIFEKTEIIWFRTYTTPEWTTVRGGSFDGSIGGLVVSFIEKSLFPYWS